MTLRDNETHSLSIYVLTSDLTVPAGIPGPTVAQVSVGHH